MQSYFEDLTRPGGLYSTASYPQPVARQPEPRADDYAGLTPKERMQRRKQEEIARKTQALNQAAREALEAKAVIAQRKEEQMRRTGEIPKVQKPDPPTKISQLNPLELDETSFSRASETMISEKEAFEEVPYNGTVDSLGYSRTGAMGQSGQMGYSGAQGYTGTLGYTGTGAMEYTGDYAAQTGASRTGTMAYAKAGSADCPPRDSLEYSSSLAGSRSMRASSNPRHEDRVISSSGYYDVDNYYEDDFESEDEDDAQPYDATSRSQQSMASTVTNPLETFDGTRRIGETRASSASQSMRAPASLQTKIEELKERCITKIGVKKFGEIYEYLREQRQLEIDDDIVRGRQIMANLEGMVGKQLFNECFLIDQIIFLENEHR